MESKKTVHCIWAEADAKVDMEAYAMANADFAEADAGDQCRGRCKMPMQRPVQEANAGGQCRGRCRRLMPEASFRGAGGAVAPPRKKKKRKKRKKKKEKKRWKRKKGTMTDVKLLHTKCCFFQFFQCRGRLKNKKFFAPPRKSWNDAPGWCRKGAKALYNGQSRGRCGRRMKKSMGRPMQRQMREANSEADKGSQCRGWHKSCP